ncbi:MFS transporter [Congregicoccus parvus]|uniref:MFS transporter n=1 Tax=Congregicoccus parvus TaxID=3081749 RepID=UPI003FA5EBE2
MPRPASLLLVVIYLGFISLGLPDGTLGVAWPRMHGDLSLPVGLAGVLLLIGTVLSGCSSMASGAIIRRFTTGPVVLTSCLLTGGGMLLLARAEGVWWLVAAAVPLGIGAGAVDVGLNGYVARHYSGRHMSWLHACWGIGATTGPLVVAACLGAPEGWRAGYTIIGSIQLGLAGLFACSLPLWRVVPERTTFDESNAGSGATKAPTTGADSPAGWLSAAIFALYVAVETTTGLWASTVLVVSRGIAPETAGLCATGYYGAITVGRVLSGFFVDRTGNRRMVTAGLSVAIAGVLALTVAGNVWTAALALVMIGLGFAPVYPCLMHEVPRRFAPHAALTVMGRQSAASYAGAAAMPAVTGWFVQNVSVDSVVWMVLGGTLTMGLAIRRLDRIT